MRAIDRTVVAGLAIAALLAAFWFVVLSPKREEASQLAERVEQLEQSVAHQEQIAAAAERARDDFDANYRRLVVLGKAVPDDEDTASLLVQLEEVARDANVRFSAIRLEGGGGGDPVTAPAADQTTTDQNAEEEEDGDEAGSEVESEAAPAAAPPLEAAVAGLPLGATVGPAGLPVMPYTISVSGTFFELADFLDGIDSLIRPRDGKPRVRGRLVTVDGFSLEADEQEGFPKLSATLAVTTFITPAEQGLTAGATPTGPAPGAPTPAAHATPSTP